MKNSPHRMKHERSKAIRSAQKEEYETDTKMITENEKKKGITSEHTNKIVRGKGLSKKTSHMTSPSDVTWETEPEHIHQEGARWTASIQKKTLDMAGRLQKK